MLSVFCPTYTSLLKILLVMSLFYVLVIALLFGLDFMMGIVSVSLSYKRWEEDKNYAIPLSFLVLSIVFFVMLCASLFYII